MLQITCIAVVCITLLNTCPGLVNAAGMSSWNIDPMHNNQGVYSNPKYGNLSFNVPSSWQSTLNRTAQQKYEVLVFAPQSTKSFKMFVDPLLAEREMVDFNDKDIVREHVAGLGNQLLGYAVEEQIPLLPLQGHDAIGYYFSITDKKKAKPFEWQCMTQGRIIIGVYYLQFTIFSQTLEASEISEALAMLASAQYSKINN